MTTFQLLFNGHAGAGLGELMIVAGIVAFAASAVIFAIVYRARPSSWLRILGLFYTFSAITLAISALAYFGPLALVLFVQPVTGLVIAIGLG